jgi:hypothetical protein
VGAIDYKTNISEVADLFAPTGRSYGKPTSLMAGRLGNGHIRTGIIKIDSAVIILLD